MPTNPQASQIRQQRLLPAMERTPGPQGDADSICQLVDAVLHAPAGVLVEDDVLGLSPGRLQCSAWVLGMAVGIGTVCPLNAKLVDSPSSYSEIKIEALEGGTPTLRH